jgi:hypothetical protein
VTAKRIALTLGKYEKSFFLYIFKCAIDLIFLEQTLCNIKHGVKMADNKNKCQEIKLKVVKFSLMGVTF